MLRPPSFPRKAAISLLCGACLSAPLAPAFAADEPVVSDTTLTWGGFAKLAVLFSHFQNGAVAQGPGRDFYLPNTTPVAAPGVSAPAHNYLNFQAKETRLFLKGDSTVEGHKVGGYVEMDFIVNQDLLSTYNATGASATATNAYTPGLRRAFVTVDNWLFGQEWTTFQNVATLPDVVDFIGPTEGTVFVRQPQIRYTYGGFQAALESPETTVAAYTTAKSAAFSNTDDNSVPDLVLRYNLKAGPGAYSIAALARQLTDHGEVNGANGTTTGVGLSLSGKVSTFGQDDLRFMLSGGSGIGRYLGIDTVGDTVASATGQLDRSRIVNGFVAYRHVWDSQWRSSLVLSDLHASKDSDYAGAVTHQVGSASANLMYSPFSKFTLGGELRYAHRTTMNDSEGSLSRAEFMAKYEF